MSSFNHFSERRRQLLAATLLLLPCGCGFRLRGQGRYNFSSIYINGQEAPQLANDLRNALRRVDGLTVSSAPQNAEVILTLSNFNSSKDILSLSSAGRAREYMLKQSVEFALVDKEGLEWMPPDTIHIERTFLYDDSERLAREIQEVQIHESILSDMCYQIQLRLQKAQRPRPVPTTIPSTTP